MQKTSKLIVCLFTFVMCVASRGFLKNSCILCWFIQLKAFFLTSCVFWIFYQNAGSQLCFRFFFFFYYINELTWPSQSSILHVVLLTLWFIPLYLPSKNNKLNKSTQIYICCSQTEVKSDKTLTTSENLLPMPILTCALTWFPVQIGRIGRRGGASISDDTDPETVVHVGSESCHLVAPLGCLVHNGGPWAIGQFSHLQPVLLAAFTMT